MEFRDYYETLGVDEDADADAIKRAYRRMARRYHPDVSTEADAEERFKAVNEAYEVLKDPEKRQAYDELRRSPYRDGFSFEPPPDWNGGEGFSGTSFTGADAGVFSDFFQAIFGGENMGRGTVRRSAFSSRGNDVHGRIEVSLEEACRGGRRRIELADSRIGPDGRFGDHTRRLDVTIPAGVAEGQRIRLGGQGSQGFGEGASGDLYLEVRIAPHPIYAVHGRDVELSLPVAPWEAALGATVEVPTLHGPVKLTIPAGSGNGTRLRMRGRGLPGSPAGDQIAVLRVETPAAETPSQRERYQQLKAAFDFDPRRELRAEAARTGGARDG
ncbi:MAG: DnaJ domain-containing protein [bacterium]|nr:DnaJ domain-containing protein [bacterium]